MKIFLPEGKDKELLDMIRRMAAMAEIREPETASHRERVRGYCMVLGRGLSLAAKEAEAISLASLLHDVGKVRLPEAIALKKGDLTPYEWDVMKRHTSYGEEILKGSPSGLLQTAEIIALTHHERWDGSGYPQALRGENIPLSGRLVALADVFDALTTKRTYKDEISVENALQLINDSSGQLFDPEIVKVFVENCDEILKIRKLV